MNDDRATYALLRARIDLRMEELREALDLHEQTGRWKEHEFLERVETSLAELVTEVPAS